MRRARVDNLTHTLTGLMLARAGLDRLTPRATLILVLASNAPDIDIAAGAAGPLAYLDHHRGWTHALAGAPVMAALTVAAARLFHRKPLPWARAFLAALVGALAHTGLDWTNVYGVRLFEPFSRDWSQAGVTSVVDLWIWAALGLAVAAPWIARLVNAEIGARPGRGRGWAAFALAFLLLYNGGRAVLHARAVASLEARIYPGGLPLRTSALPTPANPFEWVGLVETDADWSIHRVRLWEEFDPLAGRIYYKPGDAALLEKVRRTDTFRRFLVFSQWPLWRAAPAAEPEGGVRVEAVDVRFGAPEEGRFRAHALLDARRGVIEEGFSFGPFSPGHARQRF